MSNAVAAHLDGVVAAWSAPLSQFPPENVFADSVQAGLRNIVSKDCTHQAAIQVLKVQQLDSYIFSGSFAPGFPYLVKRQ